MQKWLSEAPPNWIGALEFDDYEDYYQTGIENPELARRKRDAKCTTEDCILRDYKDKDKKTRILAELVLYRNFTFKVTQEAVVSIALLQLPALFLSTFGIMRASGWTDRLLALLIIFVPFCLVEVLSLFEFYQANFQLVIDKVKIGVEKGLKFACGIFYEKVMSILHFLPANDARKRDRMLCVGVAKVFFGSCLQLCFQLVLLFGYTNPGDRELSQYLSLAAILASSARQELILSYLEETQLRKKTKRKNAFLFIFI